MTTYTVTADDGFIVDETASLTVALLKAAEMMNLVSTKNLTITQTRPDGTVCEVNFRGMLN
jgi:hypothetical protein